MTLVPGFGRGCLSKHQKWLVLLFVSALAISPMSHGAGLPRRLILCLDGVSYRDMVALQQGLTYKDPHGWKFHRQAFNQGYFPVSRLIATYPSISDPSWSEILGDQAPPGYQRTYFDATKDRQVSLNGVTSSEEYEEQMTWQMEGGFHRMMGYAAPQRAYKYEVDSIIKSFLKTRDGRENYYALVHTTDSAQHLSGDIFAMLSTLDQKLQHLRAVYRASEGRELEILLLSDHGNNHAGAGKRVLVLRLLKKAGYRIAKSIQNENDVVLPTAGIESWVEIHNSPARTEALVLLLTHLKGADLVTGELRNSTNRFVVMNWRGERAMIDWNPVQNSYRYSAEVGDPLGYLPVIEVLKKKNAIDASGFAPADAWMVATFTNHYPVALERIVRGHTRVALNPASVIVSLKNGYIHSGWFIREGLGLTKAGGTHGALDDINSDGILVSSFEPTKDTTSDRVAALFDDFKGKRDARDWATHRKSRTQLETQATPHINHKTKG
jgi:hypothetical protein